jgi:uncharacterized membrane protein
MDIWEIVSNPDNLAFVFLAFCLTVTIVSRRTSQGQVPKTDGPMRKEEELKTQYAHLFAHAARLKEAESSQTSKSLRKAYRRNWAERILGAKAYPEAREIIRNLIMTNTALLSAVLISFGLLISGFTVLINAGGAAAELKLISISTLLIYSLFMLISESRILNYIPILLWVDSEIIGKMQNKDKPEYIAQLMDDAFDMFSDSLRAIFYAVVCIFWFFNTPVFIIATFALTFVVVSSDFDRRVRISIF